MDQNILRLKSLEHKKITIYREGLSLKIPICTQICLIFLQLKNNEFQLYSRFKNASIKEKTKIKETLYKKYKKQKISNEEIEYGHPYTDSWKNMIVNIDNSSDSDPYLTYKVCSSFWDEINDIPEINVPNFGYDFKSILKSRTIERKSPKPKKSIRIRKITFNE